MKFEDAFYYKIMMMSGFSDGYEEWLNHYLCEQDPLSEVVLELACCGSDNNKIISVLHNYCEAQPFDKSAIADRVRLFFKDEYYSNRMNKEEISFFMSQVANNVGVPEIYDSRLWGSMYNIDEFCCLAKDGIISWGNFDFAFFSYLDNGTPIDWSLIWSKNIQKKESVVDKIKKKLKK